MSRLRALKLRPNGTCALISISTPGKDYSVAIRAGGWSRYLALQFDDVASQAPAQLGDEQDWLVQAFARFDEEDAREVADFIRGAAADGCEDLVVHCDAGLSRSVAIAEAARRAGLADMQLWECEQPLRANPLVLMHMRDALAAAPTTRLA